MTVAHLTGAKGMNQIDVALQPTLCAQLVSIFHLSAGGTIELIFGSQNKAIINKKNS